MNTQDIFRPEHVARPFITPHGGCLVMRPGTGVRLIPFLEDQLVERDNWRGNPWVSDVLHVAEFLPREVAHRIWIEVLEDGNIVFNFSANDREPIKQAIIRGGFNRCKGLLLYAFMWSNTMRVGSFRGRRSIVVADWENICEYWGFPGLPEGIASATGGLPSRSAVYVADYTCRTVNNQTHGWRVEYSNLGPNLYATSAWEGPMEIDLDAPNYLNCLDLSAQVGREAAWHILKDIS